MTKKQREKAHILPYFGQNMTSFLSDVPVSGINTPCFPHSKSPKSPKSRESRKSPESRKKNTAHIVVSGSRKLVGKLVVFLSDSRLIRFLAQRIIRSQYIFCLILISEMVLSKEYAAYRVNLTVLHVVLPEHL